MGSLRLPVSLAILPGAESRTRVWLELGRTGCRHFPSTLGFSCSALERLTLERAMTLPLMSAVLPLRLLFDGGTFSTGRLDKEKKACSHLRGIHLAGAMACSIGNSRG